MAKRGIVRYIASVAVAAIVIGALPIAAWAESPGPDGGARPPAGIETDEGKTKPGGGGTGAVPSANHGPDVPGEPVRVDKQPLGRIPVPAGPSSADVQAARDAIAASGSARVNVTARPPRGLTADAASPDAGRHQAEIARSLDLVQDRLRGTGSRELRRIEVYPWASYQLTAAGLDALLADPGITSIELDGSAQSTLDVSTGVVDSDLLNTAGVLGNGYDGSPVGANEVVIIDSGVDNDHAAFAGRIVAEACFSAGADCPGGVTSSTGANSAENCTFSTQCDHGTHVASIAAGTIFTGGHEGVARGAKIVAIQVASDVGGAVSFAHSDVNAALQHAINRRNGGANISAVNMSIGINGFARTAACDSENGTFAAAQALAANLQSLGVAVVASAGNDNLVGVSYPACLSSVFAVSATDDSDVPAGFTDSGALTDWWAPGVSIDAAIPGTDTHTTKSGTSMAAPHVTGAFALLRECVDGNGVQITNNSAVTRLNNTGVNVTDNGATRKRINVLDAATGLVNNNDFASPETVPPLALGGSFNDFDFTVCSDAEPGEPGPFSIDNGIWYTWSPSATGMATISTEDGGGNVTTFDSTLTVYTGSSLGSLTTMAADDDSGIGLRSLIKMPVHAGTTYRIKVDGFGAANGLLNLHLELNQAVCQGVAVTMLGTSLNDTINGTSGNDVIAGAQGNDTINSLGGNDRICGDQGEDIIVAGSGEDLVFGGPGADDIGGANGNDTLLGNAGGGDLDDVGDIIKGGSGNDTLDGWVGDDHLTGGPGTDTILGAAGIDTANYDTVTTGGVTANLAAGTASGAHGSDSLNQVENLVGSPFNDVLTGDNLVNVISGGGGHDTIQGAGNNDVVGGDAGNDTVRGGGGNDTVRGHAGNDALIGQAGIDLCNGGPGSDTAASCETIIAVP